MLPEAEPDVDPVVVPVEPPEEVFVPEATEPAAVPVALLVELEPWPLEQAAKPRAASAATQCR